jgi:hypothetical protein
MMNSKPVEQVAEMNRLEGIRKGFKEGVEKSVRVLLANTELSETKIASLAGVSIVRVKKLSKQVRAK